MKLRTPIIILSSLVLILAFNNCGGGFTAFPQTSQNFSGSLGSTTSPSPTPGSGTTTAPLPFSPKINLIIGANGNPGGATGLALWQQMGLRFSRIEIDAASATSAQDLQNQGYFDKAHDPDILFNNANGISNLILLAYTPTFNAAVPGDSKSAPVDDGVWQAYVDAVVKHYSAPPFNVKYFQVWNEAAGTLTGGSPQASFWHGGTNLNQPYTNAMQDYVNLIHIPAAKIIRSYGAYVVYGGWPDQGGLGNYETWLEYQSPNFNQQTMLDWTDYLDVHYLWSNDMNTLYQRYVGTGKIRGVWQSEVGFSYMENQNYLPSLMFSTAIMALTNGWKDPNQFVLMPYHWDGGQSFMLTNGTQLHEPGVALQTMTSLLTGTLSLFTAPVTATTGSASALYSGNQIVFLLEAPQGTDTLTVTNLPAPASGFSLVYKDVVTGADLTSSVSSSSWSGTTMKIQLNVPAGRADQSGTLQNQMGYVIVTPK